MKVVVTPLDHFPHGFLFILAVEPWTWASFLSCLGLQLWYWTDFATPFHSTVSCIRGILSSGYFCRTSCCLCSLLCIWEKGAGNWCYGFGCSLSWMQVKIWYCQKICDFQEDWVTAGSPNYLHKNMLRASSIFSYGAPFVWYFWRFKKWAVMLFVLVFEIL